MTPPPPLWLTAYQGSHTGEGAKTSPVPLEFLSPEQIISGTSSYWLKPPWSRLWRSVVPAKEPGQGIVLESLCPSSSPPPSWPFVLLLVVPSGTTSMYSIFFVFFFLFYGLSFKEAGISCEADWFDEGTENHRVEPHLQGTDRDFLQRSLLTPALPDLILKIS